MMVKMLKQQVNKRRKMQESMNSTPDNLEYGVYDGKKPPTPISLENTLSYSLVSVPVEPQKKLETILE